MELTITLEDCWKQGLWRMRDCETIRMIDMGNPHIRNTIKLLEGNMETGNYPKETVELWLKYLSRFETILEGREKKTEEKEKSANIIIVED